MSNALLEVSELVVGYGRNGRRAPVVHEVSFVIGRGETLGIVGQSGSGKSTVARAVLGLTPATAGSIRLDGEEIASIRRRDRARIADQVGVVFQDPFSSLDPAMTIGEALDEPRIVRQRMRRRDALSRARACLDEVSLPSSAMERYPQEFSGGQRQRIAIARALAPSPRLLVCDEAVSALDLSVQAQVINLLADLRDAHGIAMIFITHDLAVVGHIADQILVLNGGRVVDYGPADQVISAPTSEYTRTLLRAALVPDPDEQRQRRERRLAAAAPG